MSFNFKKFFKIALQALFVVLVFFFLGRSLWNNWGRLEIDFSNINYFYLSFSLILFTLAWAGAALAWGHIAKKLKNPLKAKDSIKLWVWSQSARYIPGSVWQVVGRVHMAEKKGMKKGKTLASIAVETSNLVISSLVVFALSLPFWPTLKTLSSYRPFFIAGVLVFGFLHPRAFNWTLGVFIQRLDKEEKPANYDFKEIIGMLMPYVLIWLVFGLAFFFLAISLNIGGISLLPIAIGTFALSWVIGFLVVIAPGGLGAREGALVFFLGLFISNPLAILLAVLSRVMMILAELILLAITALFKA